MPRWQPRTPQESLQTSLERIKTRIETTKQEFAELEGQRRQVEQALKALGRGH
jgi:prefoldin subunit 5